MKRTMQRALSVLSLSLFPVAAMAHPSDIEFAPLLRDAKLAAAEQRAVERIAANAKDEAAIWAFAFVTTHDVAKQEKAIAFSEACLAQLPASAKCHYALAVASIQVARSKGVLAGLDSAPRARDAFIKSVELDPKDFQSRWDLNRFYLEAPGVVGGSVQAAIANSEDHRKLNVSQGLLLRAQTHIHQREFDKAEAVLASAVPAGDDLVQRKLAELWTSLGFAMFKDSKAELARGVFERRVAVEEGNAQFHYLLARAHLRLNSLNPAIASLERALRIKADDVDSYFALAFAQEAKGDMPKAIAAFEKILELSPTGNFSAAAKARLEALRK